MKTLFMMLSSLTVLTLMTVTMGWCHGVEGTVEPVKAYCVAAQYDDGEPMSYAAVEIQAPQTDVPFQSGRTDRNGCFMVRTDGPGNWQAVVSDGMGHRLALDFTVGEGNASPETDTARAPAASGRINRTLAVVAGLAIIFGLCGFFYGWKARRNGL